jgi:hypothetical protein
LIAKAKHWSGKVWVGLMCLITPRCHEMTRLISAEREKPHSGITKLRMRWHYGICVWCKRYHDQIGLLGMLGRAFPEESSEHGKSQLTDDAKARLKEALTRDSND